MTIPIQTPDRPTGWPAAPSDRARSKPAVQILPKRAVLSGDRRLAPPRHPLRRLIGRAGRGRARADVAVEAEPTADLHEARLEAGLEVRIPGQVVLGIALFPTERNALGAVADLFLGHAHHPLLLEVRPGLLSGLVIPGLITP